MNQNQGSSDWTVEVPTKPGFYWFWGWRSNFCIKAKIKPELMVVELRFAGPPDKRFPLFIANGQFIYPEDGAKGFWKPQPAPTDLPNLEVLDDATLVQVATSETDGPEEKSTPE